MRKDISDLAIKVICPRYDHTVLNGVPTDIEGTLLCVIGYGSRVNELIMHNEYLTLIYEKSDYAKFTVRWDNDKRSTLLAENFLIRNFGKFPVYKSIWKDINLYDVVDTRPYHTLRPFTALPVIPRHSSKKIINKKIDIKPFNMNIDDIVLDLPSFPNTELPDLELSSYIDIPIQNFIVKKLKYETF